MRRLPWLPLAGFALVFGFAIGCHEEEVPENAGQPCEAPADCYVDVDPAELSGAIECLDRVEGGYCTHLCEVDEDCCAVPGECLAGYPQVCAPFENSTEKRCFLSCEADVIGELEESEYCRENAFSDFSCRSTGGGSENRKICSP
jgi:hypothetical protein